MVYGIPDKSTILTFGGGINSRRRVADVALDECVSPSHNFDLDPQFRALQRRRPFDLVATAPNGAAIKGFAQLIKQDGTVSTLVQAGANVYSWDGSSTFSLVGTVSSASKLRGPREHNFTLDEIVIITDLEKQSVVKKWDGTSFVDLAHNLGGNFFAKYCRVEDERAFFGNVTAGTATPHVVLASAREDPEDLSNADRPGDTGVSAADPWFLPMPDLRPVNGLEAAFGQFIVSTERGRLYRLTGADSTDYALAKFHLGSAVVGSEAVKNIGNDVILGLSGRIESLIATEQFGDVEVDDISRWIAPSIENVTAWTIEYDRLRQRVFCFPNNQSAVWVLHKNVLNDPQGQGVSPWSRWTTNHDLGFSPDTVMQLINPLNGQDAVYMGGPDGSVYRLDGEGGQDGGTTDIEVLRRSGLIVAPERDAHDISGWIHYRKLFETTVTIRILGGGTAVYEQEISRFLPENTDVGVYNGESYYGDQQTVYGVGFSGRIHEQEWAAAGQGSNFQVEVEISGSEDFDIEEIGIEFNASKA